MQHLQIAFLLPFLLLSVHSFTIPNPFSGYHAYRGEQNYTLRERQDPGPENLVIPVSNHLVPATLFSFTVSLFVSFAR